MKTTKLQLTVPAVDAEQEEVGGEAGPDPLQPELLDELEADAARLAERPHRLDHLQAVVQRLHVRLDRVGIHRCQNTLRRMKNDDCLLFKRIP